MKRTLATALVLVAAVGTEILSARPCPAPQFTEPSRVNLTARTAVIVTHASTQWDYYQSSKYGMDKVVAYAKAKGAPVVYLQDPHQYQTYFYHDCEPTYYVSSWGGEFSFAVPTNHVVSVGGHFSACQYTTFTYLFRDWEKRLPTSPLYLTVVAEGSYLDSNTVEHTARHFDRVREFVRVYGTHKINLGHLLRILQTPQDQRAFLNAYLKNLQLPKTHRAVVQIDGVSRFMAAGSRSDGPVLTVNFVLSQSPDAYFWK